MKEDNNPGIAVIGMAGRFPGARNVEEFWRNLRDGVETISFFTDAELLETGITFPPHDPHYVKARGVVDGADLFDAEFFGINPKEAEITDPQHRLFLECAWEALEDAGCDPASFPGLIGVFAGKGVNTYFTHNLLSRPEVLKLVGSPQIMFANEKDYLPTRVSYKLNLRGPSLNVQTACSTSLVATCFACQSLLSYQCDMALAGGVCLVFPQKQGHFYQEGAIFSPDGHCRAFDAKAGGTVLSDGAGIVVLKRLDDAMNDGDQIYAVIKGFAVNNDGASKIGFTAPSIEGQTGVISMAQAMAEVDPATVSYVETHGTATPLGDPIEIAALTKAFRTGTAANGFCAIGSLKSNVGHLDAAAGVAGLMKTCLALRNGLLPPSLHFETPNPQIDFANSPFHVNAKLSEWPPGDTPRRAGVSSFGIGGTNAHVVLEEAPAHSPAAPTRAIQLLVLSARSGAALEAATDNLANHLERHHELALADAAFTLQMGRRTFGHRRILACSTIESAIAALRSRDRDTVFTRSSTDEHRSVVFMFPGQGAQQVNMGRELYETEPVFKRALDACAEQLSPHLGLNLRTVLYPGPDQADAARQQLAQTHLTQPALFAVEYALAQLWLHWGVRPKAMIGHSSGEYVAACLAGVFSLEHALELVAARGRLMQEQPGGAMLAVRLSEVEMRPLLDDSLSIGAINAPARCVVSGPHAVVNSLREQLARRGIACRPLETSHAFHSAMMEPVRQPFIEILQKMRLNAPQVPFVSNVTGRWITAAEATDPEYWANHLRQPVRFADGVAVLLAEPQQVLLEVGPGQTCASLARQHPARQTSQAVLASLIGGTGDDGGEPAVMLTTLGRLWLEGVHIDWPAFQAGGRRRRVSLPTYPFERKRYWVESAALVSQAGGSGGATVVAEQEEEQAGIVAAPRATASGSIAPGRKARLLARLSKLLGDLSGRIITEAEFTTTFVELGFDSLLLTQASQIIEKAFGIRIQFRQLLTEFATLKQLADHLEVSLPADATPHTETTRASAIARSGDDIVTVPLTEAQREVWYACQLGADRSCAFNQSIALIFRGPLRRELLRQALEQLVSRHEALRATISPDGDTQRIHPRAAIELPTVDWTALTEPEREARIQAVFQEEATRPFDLCAGPLMRAQLVQLGPLEHRLFFTAHHIVCDGRSLGIVAEELGVLYSNACQGVSDFLPPPLQLSVLACKREVPTHDATEQAAEGYWLKVLSDPPPALELPSDRSRPTAMSLRGGRVGMKIGPKLFGELRHVSAKCHSTLFTTLLAGYALLLHRLSGQEEFVVGVPAADRTSPGSNRMIGHCVNFLPCRLQATGDATLGDFLTGVQRMFAEAFQHRQLSFGQLLQKLSMPRNTIRSPLVSVTFNLGRMKNPPVFHELETELILNPHSAISFDLGLSGTETVNGLEFDCCYAADLFDGRTIQRWLHHYRTILEAFTESLDQRVATTPLLTPEEMHELLFTRNAPNAPHPPQLCIHQLFEAQAQQTPDLAAIMFDGRPVTYHDLNERANRLACRLQSLGVGPDIPVGIYMKRSPEMLIGVLAVLKAGGAYAPLDPAYPAERLRFMAEGARMSVVLTHKPLRNGNPLANANCRLVYTDEPHSGAAAEQSLRATAAPNNLCYIIHTSGSTGTPKGVAMEHQPAVSLVSWQTRNPVLPAGTRTLQFTSLSFDVSFQEIFSTWCAGGTLILIDEDLQRDPARLVRFIAEAKIERLFLPFVALQELADVADELGIVPDRLREVLTAGEQLRITPAIARLFARLPNCRLHNQYGPTESHVVVTSNPLADNPATWPPFPSIGKPVAHARIYILDARRQPVPIGVSGELYIAGESLARGYLHQPDLTAERFLADPFLNRPGARMYKTGDLARWDGDGNLEFLGRIDHQVKVRGFRVELGEVELALSRHPAIRECVVTVREESPGRKRLVAYAVSRADGPPARNAAVRRYLLEKLPEFMVPSSLVWLEAMPLTPSGKVDRRALPPPEAMELAPAAEVAPRTETEEALARIWCDVLGLQRVGVEDNFFELGGHSLLAAQVLARVRRVFQVEVPMRRLFETPTIAALAETIEAALVTEVAQLSEAEAGRFVDTIA